MEYPARPYTPCSERAASLLRPLPVTQEGLRGNSWEEVDQVANLPTSLRTGREKERQCLWRECLPEGRPRRTVAEEQFRAHMRQHARRTAPRPRHLRAGRWLCNRRKLIRSGGSPVRQRDGANQNSSGFPVRSSRTKDTGLGATRRSTGGNG